MRKFLSILLTLIFAPILILAGVAVCVLDGLNRWISDGGKW
jgi:hypothetical protein